MRKPTQATFAGSGFEAYRKPTRRELFLAEMERVVPWGELCRLVEPVYPKSEGPGRPAIGLARMLRIYFLQHWFNLSDPAVEEALYDSASMRTFVGIDLGREPAPDESTVCKFRHLLEGHGLGRKLFEEVGRYLQAQGLKVSSGTIVDATIINAPSSTKNASGERDPEMKQTMKGHQWYFGMKAHVGVDSKTKLIHSAGRYRKLTQQDRLKNRAKSCVRAKVEHSIGVLKRIFGFAKLRYRGIAKNANHLFVTCALANLYIARRYLFMAQGT